MDLHEQFAIFSRNEKCKSLCKEMNQTAEEVMRHRIGPGIFEFSNDPATIYHIKNWLKDLRAERKFWLLAALVNRFEVQHAFKGEFSPKPSEANISLYRRWQKENLNVAREYRDTIAYYRNRLKEFGH